MKIAASPKAPKVSIDYVKNEVSLPKDSEMRLIYQREGMAEDALILQDERLYKFYAYKPDFSKAIEAKSGNSLEDYCYVEVDDYAEGKPLIQITLKEGVVIFFKQQDNYVMLNKEMLQVEDGSNEYIDAEWNEEEGKGIPKAKKDLYVFYYDDEDKSILITEDNYKNYFKVNDETEVELKDPSVIIYGVYYEGRERYCESLNYSGELWKCAGVASSYSLSIATASAIECYAFTPESTSGLEEIAAGTSLNNYYEGTSYETTFGYELYWDMANQSDKAIFAYNGFGQLVQLRYNELCHVTSGENSYIKATGTNNIIVSAKQDLYVYTFDKNKCTKVTDNAGDYFQLANWDGEEGLFLKNPNTAMWLVEEDEARICAVEYDGFIDLEYDIEMEEEGEERFIPDRVTVEQDDWTDVTTAKKLTPAKILEECGVKNVSTTAIALKEGFSIVIRTKAGKKSQSNMLFVPVSGQPEAKLAADGKSVTCGSASLTWSETENGADFTAANGTFDYYDSSKSKWVTIKTGKAVTIKFTQATDLKVRASGTKADTKKGIAGSFASNEVTIHVVPKAKAE